MDSNRFCPDPDTPDIVAHYEIPCETYCRLQDLVLLMEESESTKPWDPAIHVRRDRLRSGKLRAQGAVSSPPNGLVAA